MPNAKSLIEKQTGEKKLDEALSPYELLEEALELVDDAATILDEASKTLSRHPSLKGDQRLVDAHNDKLEELSKSLESSMDDHEDDD